LVAAKIKIQKKKPSTTTTTSGSGDKIVFHLIIAQAVKVIHNTHSILGKKAGKATGLCLSVSFSHASEIIIIYYFD